MTAFAPNPFKIDGQHWLVGRGVRIRFPLREKTDDGGWVAKDLSAANLEVHLRSYVDADGPWVHSGALTKGDAVNGWIDHYLAFGAVAYPSGLIWELVEVDTAVVVAGTPTGKQESIVLRFREPILAAPAA